MSLQIGNYGLFRTTGAEHVPLTDKLLAHAAGEFFDWVGYYSDIRGEADLPANA